jgi:hypothetical protein
MSRWKVVALRCGGPDLNGRVWTPPAVQALCALAPGVPVRAYLSAPGTLTHPTGRAVESVVGHVERAWFPPAEDDLFAVVVLNSSPRAQVVERGMRAMAAHGALHLLGCSVLVDRRRFSVEPPARPVVIRTVLAWTALDFVTHAAIGGHVIRALEPDEDPEGRPHDG